MLQRTEYLSRLAQAFFGAEFHETLCQSHAKLGIVRMVADPVAEHLCRGIVLSQRTFSVAIQHKQAYGLGKLLDGLLNHRAGSPAIPGLLHLEKGFVDLWSTACVDRLSKQLTCVLNASLGVGQGGLAVELFPLRQAETRGLCTGVLRTHEPARRLTGVWLRWQSRMSGRQRDGPDRSGSIFDCRVEVRRCLLVPLTGRAVDLLERLQGEIGR